MTRLSLFFCFSIFFFSSLAQVSPTQNVWQMEMEREMEESRIQDSIRHAQDSLQMLWVKFHSSARPNQFIDSLKEVYTVNDGDLFAWRDQFKGNVENLIKGEPKKHRELWVLLVLGIIILFFSIIKFNYSSQLNVMMHAFYSNTALTQINKAEKVYNRWPFILLYVLFGFIFGMFIFLGAGAFYSSIFKLDISFYLLVSFAIIMYFSLKVVVIKLLGFVFEVQPISKEYNSILFLSYFNSAILLLPVIIAFALLPQAQIDYLFAIFSAVVLLFFTLQFVRVCYYTLITYKFSKFYLFLYFCALEIGPIIIIIKAIGL